MERYVFFFLFAHPSESGLYGRGIEDVTCGKVFANHDEIGDRKSTDRVLGPQEAGRYKVSSFSRIGVRRSPSRRRNCNLSHVPGICESRRS